MTEFAAPATIAYGSSDTVSVTGLPVDATGTLTFTSSGSTLCVATLPATSCQTSTTLAPGTYPVTATYSGDTHYNGSTASGASFTVTKADVSFTDSAAPSSVPYGTADTVSVAGIPGDATGTVTFTSGGSTLCVATLPAISCQTSATLAVGTYPVTATFSGDANYNSGTASGASFDVTQADTSMTEYASPATIVYGTQDTLSVTDLPLDATGTVTFTSGGSTLCTATLPATSCQTSMTLAPGTYPVTATYSGDGSYNGSTATGASFTVTKATITLDETASPIAIVFGTADTVSASGLPDGATGTLTFTSGGTTLCVATLPAKSCTTSVTLDPAVYPVTATYSGDTNDTSATASTAQFTVIKADTAIVVDVNPKAATPGSPITVWVTGLPAGISGTVTFTSGGRAICTATLPALSCTASMDLPPGSYPVTATYSGNTDYNGSTAIGGGQLGVLSVVSDPTVPTTGSGMNTQGMIVGSIMVFAGTTTVVMSRRIRRRQHRPA
jgi:Bacterial Ig-like domain (group 3)